ncbi:MAG: ABC transporter ATP-binding protein [Ilumatobacteraceae bacterium]
MTVELELRSITKHYPGVVANDGIDLTVHSGEVHAIVGENGAGKSTLMSILYGLVTPDEGEILVRGEPAHFRSPLDAIHAGLGMVHQSFQLFPTMTVAENVVFGQEPRRGLFIDRAATVRVVADLADQFGLGVDVNARIEDLGVGVLQRVEILKVLYRDARVLILDEPTAVLTPQERDVLFDVVRQLRDSGRTIVFITHKLNEVVATSDRVTVLRRGRVVDEQMVADTTPAQMSLAMTGRNVDTSRRRHEHPVGERVLAVEGLRVDDVDGIRRVDGVDLDVAAGEIVGIAGVTGSGQTELVEALIGLRHATGGTIRLHDTDLVPLDVRGRRDAGLSYVPEDRHRVGSAGAATAGENLLMGYQRNERFQRRRWLRRNAVEQHANDLIESFDIQVSGPEQEVRQLSGGNLQKVVVAREMSHEKPVLLVEQPTRGVDVGSIEFIHGQIIEQRDAGRAIVLISTELWEVLALSSRILVMFDGRIVAELLPNETDEVEIGLYMTGARGQVADV